MTAEGLGKFPGGDGGDSVNFDLLEPPVPFSDVSPEEQAEANAKGAELIKKMLSESDSGYGRTMVQLDSGKWVELPYAYFVERHGIED